MVRKTWISFDVWGTLIKANPSYRPARNKLIAEILFPELVMPEEDWQTLIKKTKDFCDFSNESLGQQMSWQQSILVVVRDFYPMLDKNVIGKRFSDYRYEDVTLVNKYPPLLYSKETLVVLELLRGKVGMNILCNTGFMDGTLVEKSLRLIGIHHYFDFHKYSDIIHASKPSKAAFNALEINTFIFPKGITGKSGILHVGDNPFSDGGSINVGIDFLHINGSSGKTISHVLNYI